jgi:hypothetical protein
MTVNAERRISLAGSSSKTINPSVGAFLYCIKVFRSQSTTIGFETPAVVFVYSCE